MRRYSAAEAVAPAWKHTRDFLFRPYRFGRTWKFTISAYLSLMGTVFFPFPLGYLVFALMQARGGHSTAAIGIAVLSLIGLVVWMAIYYLCSRLQMAFIDTLIHRQPLLAPSWRKVGSRAFEWTSLKAGFGFATFVLLAAPFAAYLTHMSELMKIMQSMTPGQPPPPAFFSSLFAGYGLVMLVFFILFLISAIVTDFVLPSILLENLSFPVAFRRMTLFFQEEPGQAAAFIGLKTALGIVGYITAIICFEIALILIVLVVVLLGLLIGFILHAIGLPKLVLTILAFVVGIPIYFFLIFYGAPITVGTLLTFLQSYTLYFLGGRYPLLGELLEPSALTAAPFTPPPSFPSDDDTSGPDFPLNPQPAT